MNTIPAFDDALPTDVFLEVEEIEETPTEETPPKDQVDEPTEGSDDPPASEPEGADEPLARVAFESLVEKGILEPDENFKGTFEELDSKFESLPNKLLRSAIDELPEHSQQILKFIATAGQNLQPEELRNFIKEFYNEQDLPDVSTLDSARSYMEAHLKATTGLRESAIRVQLDELEDEGTLIEEAEKVLKSKATKTDKLIQDKEEANKQLADEQRQFVQSVNTALQETTWSKAQQQKVLQTIPKTNNILNEVVKNPKAYVQLIDFLAGFNGKEFDIERFRKQGESRTISTVKERLEKSGFSSASSKTQSTTDVPQDDLFKEFKPIV